MSLLLSAIQAGTKAAADHSAWAPVVAGAVGGIIGVLGAIATAAYDWRQRRSDLRQQQRDDRRAQSEKAVRAALRDVRQCSVDVLYRANKFANGNQDGAHAPKQDEEAWGKAYLAAVNSQEELRALVSRNETRDAIDTLVEELRHVHDLANETGSHVSRAMDASSAKIRELTRGVSDEVEKDIAALKTT